MLDLLRRGALDPIRTAKRLRLALGYAPMTLGSVVSTLAEVHGDSPMVDEEGWCTLTFNEAAMLVDEWAAVVAASTSPGDRVVIATPNGYAQLFATLAASRAGAIPAPVNPQMTEAEVEHVVADAGAALVIRSIDQLDGPAVKRQNRGGREVWVGGLGVDRCAGGDDKVAALFYTSGTTGRPKGAALTHHAILGSLASMAWLPQGVLSGEALLALPIAHIMGFVAALGAGCAGVPVRSRPRFHPVEVLNDIETRRCSLFVGVPSMYKMLANAGAAERDLKSIRVWVSGADVMPGELALEFKRFGASAELPGIGPVGEALFAEGYGMVETAGGAAAKVSPPLLPVGLGSSVGVALPGYTFRVVDDEDRPVGIGETGNLQLKGPGLLTGYWGDAAASAEAMTFDGWLRTGDRVRKGPLGLVTFQGRAKNVLKVGGFSVYPPEVEEVLESHDSVAECAVVGLPDVGLGEVPVAAVVLAADAPGVTEVELLDFAADRLAAYKAPTDVWIVDSLPRTGTGKVRRDEVIDILAARALEGGRASL